MRNYLKILLLYFIYFCRDLPLGIGQILVEMVLWLTGQKQLDYPRFSGYMITICTSGIYRISTCIH